jgi:hypothetical protein
MANTNVQVNDSTASAPVQLNSDRVRIAATTNVYVAIGDSTVQATDQDMIVISANVEENVLVGHNNYVSFKAISGTGIVSITELLGTDTGGFFRAASV